MLNFKKILLSVILIVCVPNIIFTLDTSDEELSQKKYENLKRKYEILKPLALIIPIASFIAGFFIGKKNKNETKIYNNYCASASCEAFDNDGYGDIHNFTK